MKVTPQRSSSVSSPLTLFSVHYPTRSPSGLRTCVSQIFQKSRGEACPTSERKWFARYYVFMFYCCVCKQLEITNSLPPKAHLVGGRRLLTTYAFFQIATVSQFETQRRTLGDGHSRHTQCRQSYVDQNAPPPGKHLYDSKM